MRLVLLLLMACCLAGCVTKQPKPAPPAATEPQLTADDIAQLKSRLDLLRVGMGRDQVMDILKLSTFNARSYADTTSTGTTYNFGNNHSLTLAMDAGNYASTLRWARFDGEMWPKHE
jgi:hypothetical protein